MLIFSPKHAYSKTIQRARNKSSPANDFPRSIALRSGIGYYHQMNHSFRDDHDDVIKWKHFPRYWPTVRGIHRSPHKGQWHGALMFSFIFAWLNGWVSNGEAGDLRRHRAHYNAIVMMGWLFVRVVINIIISRFWTPSQCFGYIVEHWYALCVLLHSCAYLCPDNRLCWFWSRVLYM